MNTYTSQSAYSRSPHTTRAHFSPIAHSVTNSSAQRIAAEQESPSTDDEAGLYDATSAKSDLGRYWTPDLFDRLQLPLTRYHD